MTKELQAQVDRLERVLVQGLHVDLSNYDDDEQAAARAKQLEQEHELEEKELAKRLKAEEAAEAATA